MRFHVLGVPHTISSIEFNACAFTQKVVKFCKMMSGRGHHIIHYGHKDSDVVCDEHVSVVTNEDWKIAYGDYDWRKSFFKYNMQDHCYKTFYANAIAEILKRKQKYDFILPFWGAGVRPICDAIEAVDKNIIVVEPGIGYGGGYWARWKIFESYALLHAFWGINKVQYCNPNWYETVIPNYFDINDFEYCDEKKDYFLFLGRVFEGKGVHIAAEAARLTGVRLVVAGQKEDSYKLPGHVDFLGYADIEKRKQLMKYAKASFLPSTYVEPFAGVQIENMLSGTPTITTDWGVFAENNIHGVTGYRCRTMSDFVKAIQNIDKIKPINCRTWGENFTFEKVAPMYEKFFDEVLSVYKGKGWYEMNNHSIDTITRTLPCN